MAEFNDNICLPLPSKETYSRLPSDGKLDILFDIMIIMAKNVQTIDNTVRAERKTNFTFSGIMGAVGGFAAMIAKFLFFK